MSIRPKRPLAANDNIKHCHLLASSLITHIFLSFYAAVLNAAIVDEHLVLDYYCTLQVDLFTGQFGYLIVFCFCVDNCFRFEKCVWSTKVGNYT